MFGPLLLLLDLKMCVLCVLCVGAYSGCPARQPPWWAAETLAEHAGIDIRSRGGGAGRERTRPRRSAGVHQGVCVFTFYVFKIIHPPEPREHLDTGFTLKSESAFRFLALLDTEKSNHITWSSTCLFVTSVVPHSLSLPVRGRCEGVASPWRPCHVVGQVYPPVWVAGVWHTSAWRWAEVTEKDLLSL